MASVLLLVDDSTSLTAEDTATQTRLETNLSHTVTVVDLADAVSTAGFDLLVISVSGGFNTYPDYSGEDIPIFSWSRGSWTMLGWSDTGGAAVGSGEVNLTPTGTSHPVHAGFTTETAMLSVGSQWRTPSSSPAAQDPRWVLSGSDVIFTFEPSSALLSGKTAVSREVGWGISSSGDVSNLTADGWSVFDAAVGWAIGDTDALAVPTNFTFTAASAARQLDASWTSVSGASTYDYEVEEDVSGTWTAFDSGSTASTSFQLTDADGVDWGTTYRGRVRAVPA